MKYPEYEVGHRNPDDFEKPRRLFQDAKELDGPDARMMYVISLKGPSARLDMILERLDTDGAVVEETGRADESQMLLLARLGRYIPECDRSSSADIFTAKYPHEDGRVSELFLEASWLDNVQPLEELEVPTELDFDLEHAA